MADQPTLYQPTKTERVGRSGIYPASGPPPRGGAQVRGQGALAHPEERVSAPAPQLVSTGVALALGRALFGGFFLFNGVNHFVKRKVLVQYAISKGVANADAAVLGSGALLIAGGLSLLAGMQPRTGAALIATFLLGVTPRMHNFWAIDDESTRTGEFINFTKNVALLGGAAIAAAVPEPWPGRLHLPALGPARALVPVRLNR